MEINLNGEKIQSESKTIMELVLDKGLKPESLIVELNANIIKQENWDTVIIKDGDKIELLSFVQGG